MEKKLLYTAEHNEWIALKERHSEEKVQYNAETSQAAASILRLSEDVRVHDKEAEEAREKQENAARQGTYGTVAGALGAVTMTGGYCGTVISAVGATALTGGLLVGGAAILGAGALLLTTAKVGERTAEGEKQSSQLLLARSLWPCWLFLSIFLDGRWTMKLRWGSDFHMQVLRELPSSRVPEPGIVEREPPRKEIGPGSWPRKPTKR